VDIESRSRNTKLVIIFPSNLNQNIDVAIHDSLGHLIFTGFPNQRGAP